MLFLVMDLGLLLLGGDAPTVATRPVANFACLKHLAMVDQAVQAQGTEESSSVKASDLFGPREPAMVEKEMARARSFGGAPPRRQSCSGLK